MALLRHLLPALLLTAAAITRPCLASLAYGLRSITTTLIRFCI